VKDDVFMWKKEAFDSLKEALSSDMVLAYFDPSALQYAL